MKILSLFDGMSVGQQAISELYKDYEYYASEIDEYAIAVTQSNFPNTRQLGSVTELYPTPNLHNIDLLIGGSPCQDLSIAKKDRKGLDGERSGLFYEYVRILNEVKPKYFILENVASMSKESKDKISEILGVQPVMINASLVSAQNRKRLFWVSSRLDLCYNCNYEQILKEIQHRGETTKAQTTSVEQLLSEKSKERNRVQDLQQEVFSSGINSEMLLGKMYDYQQEKERQETNTEEKRIPEEILRAKKERITRIWKSLSPEQQREFSEILQKIHFQARSQNEESTERSVEEKQKDYQYDWERGIVGYVEKNKHGVCFLRFYGGFDGRPYNPSEQGWNERFGELTATVSELQFIQERQTNHCSCCGGIMPVKYQQVDIPQPEDRGIMLKDILEDGDADRLKSYCIDANYYKGGNLKNYKDKSRRQLVFLGGVSQKDWAGDGKSFSRNWPQGDRVYSPEGKSATLSALGGGRGAKTGLYCISSKQAHATITENKSSPLTSAMGMGGGHVPMVTESLIEAVALRNRGQGKQPEYNGTGKANAMTSVQTDSMVEVEQQIRKLTPIECLRLQSMPDNYFDKAIYKGKSISNTQRYKMCGNAFNKEVIKHILKHVL